MSIFEHVHACLRPRSAGGPQPGTRTSPRHAGRRALVAGAATALTAGFMVALPSGSASAAVPVFPNNIIAFPDRDFVSVEGYEDRAGQTATLEVDRPGVGLIGSAEAVVDAGGVAFEVNHPGGVCWGNGTGLRITPDIKAGDIISVRFGAEAAGDIRVLDGAVDTDAVQNGATVTISGHVGPDVNKDNVEQRVIEPALRDTVIARRDIRALPGPLTPDPRGGYSSGLSFPTATTFVATYVFDDPDGAGPQTGADIAEIAANATLGERLMSWELVDPIGNRQGLTIAEFGEAGGPGFGGCPNGPLQSGPPGPTNVVAATQANGSIKLTWTPAVPIPGTPPITGYRVHAIGQTVTPVGAVTEQSEIGKRINGAAAGGTTLTGLSATESYDVEVVSVSSVGETFPAIHAIPQVDVIPPTVSASPNGGSFAVPQQVALTANEAGSQIYYTANGPDPIDPGGVLDPAASLYTGPITIAADTVLRFAAFDPSSNVSGTTTLSFVITNTPTPAAPVFGPATVGQGSISLTWTANDPSITGYGVQVYDAANAPVGPLQETTGTSLTVTGLTADTPYFVTVKAQNVNGYGPESAKLGPLTPTGAVVANAGPDQSINRRATATTVNLTGAGSTVAGATYQWTQVDAAGTPVPNGNADLMTLTGATTLTPSFSLPLYVFPMTNNPLFFRLTVTTAAGSKADTVKVTPVPGQVAIATARWKVGDFRVTGADSLVGTTIRIHRGNLAGPVIGQAPVTAAAPPATGGVFDLRARNAAAPATNPGTIWIESTDGGTAGPFTVS